MNDSNIILLTRATTRQQSVPPSQHANGQKDLFWELLGKWGASSPNIMLWTWRDELGTVENSSKSDLKPFNNPMDRRLPQLRKDVWSDTPAWSLTLNCKYVDKKSSSEIILSETQSSVHELDHQNVSMAAGWKRKVRTVSCSYVHSICIAGFYMSRCKCKSNWWN